MPSIPTLVTICSDCKREDVGVVLDWANRDAANQMMTDRYRVARHKVHYGKRETPNPWCLGSRNQIPKELVFDRKVS